MYIVCVCVYICTANSNDAAAVCEPAHASHLHTSAYVSLRQPTPAYVSILQHTSAYASTYASTYASIRQHTPACFSIRQSRQHTHTTSWQKGTLYE